MPPQAPAPTQVAPTPMPQSQIDPRLQAILRMRTAQQGGAAPGAATAPNTMGTPGAQPMPPAGGGRVMVPPGGGGGNPAAAVMKAAGGAQSPLVADQGTRALAKALIQKLMQHM